MCSDLDNNIEVWIAIKVPKANAFLFA